MIDSKKVEIKPWKTIKERWNIDKEGEHKVLREKSLRFCKTGLLSAKLQKISLLNVNNRCKYNEQLSKYKKNSEGILISKKCTFCKLTNKTQTKLKVENIYT